MSKYQISKNDIKTIYLSDGPESQYKSGLGGHAAIEKQVGDEWLEVSATVDGKGAIVSVDVAEVARMEGGCVVGQCTPIDPSSIEIC